MAEPYRTTLGPDARDRVWISTLNGSRFRWNMDQWEVKTSVADWHPIRPWDRVQTVYSQAGEKFVQSGVLDAE